MKNRIENIIKFYTEEKKIILTGTPPSTSQIYKYCRMGNFIRGYMTTDGSQKKEEYQWEIKSQYKEKIRTDDIKLIVCYYFKGKRKRDIDNFSKLWMDAGTGIIWEDDSQISELHLYKRRDDVNPRIEIKII